MRKHALDVLGAHVFATGHYARLRDQQSSDYPSRQLLVGLDPSKDQSYFLSQARAHSHSEGRSCARPRAARARR